MLYYLFLISFFDNLHYKNTLKIIAFSKYFSNNCLYLRNYQEREPVTIRIEPDSILLYNSGGPDRSIKREDFVTGKAIPKRYRNRRLGDFLKELKLTEGHATGLPALKKSHEIKWFSCTCFRF